jgi:3-deoxy-7-phosphoheptulonate synthase
MHNIENLNIVSTKEILKPIELKQKYQVTNKESDFIFNSRQTLENILSGKDKRLFAVLGPCSIHDPIAAIEYAHRLKELSEIIDDEIFVIMRVYFEKPRTTIGWKGLINDPHLNNTFCLEEGLNVARKLMLDITKIGLPIGTEALDPISPQFLADLVSWSAIGARTTESQTHREMASGLSSPVGFKNGTDGSIDIAINAILSSLNPHSFIGINENGVVSIVNTSGNKFGHIILRGDSHGPNYDSNSIKLTEDALNKHKLPLNIVIDCSHGNSRKDYKTQPSVLNDIIQQIINGNQSITGFMLESNLIEGNQPLTQKENLKYGLSITDGCIGWQETETTLLDIHKKLKEYKS